MVTRDDVRRVALSMPGVSEGPDPFRFKVDGKGIAWPWLERLQPRKARVPNPTVMAVRVASEFDKEPLIAMNPAIFFTEAHYDGFPAILVRLDEIDEDLLRIVLGDACAAASMKRRKASA